MLKDIRNLVLPTVQTQASRVFQTAVISGTLVVGKLLVTGVTSIKIPINLSSDNYTVLVSAGGMVMTAQKIIVC